MLSPTGAIVQRHDPDRFVTVLFAPAAHRETLFTLYAFNHELARAREVASVPPVALIRLQWWREVVEGAERPHEVATPLRCALLEERLEAGALLDMVAAREVEAEGDASSEQFAAYARGAGGGLMREAGRLMGAGGAELAALEGLGAACSAAGVLRNRGVDRAAQRWSFADVVDEAVMARLARAGLGQMRRWSAAALPAALPAVLVRRRLSRATRPLSTVTDQLMVAAAALRRRA